MGETATHNQRVRAFAHDEQPAIGVYPFRAGVAPHYGDTDDAWRARNEFLQSVRG